jgi:hypothetical protein
MKIMCEAWDIWRRSTDQHLSLRLHASRLLRSTTRSNCLIPGIQDTKPITVATLQYSTRLHIRWQWSPFATAWIWTLYPFHCLTWIHSRALSRSGSTQFLFGFTHGVQPIDPILEVRPKLWWVHSAKWWSNSRVSTINEHEQTRTDTYRRKHNSP